MKILPDVGSSKKINRFDDDDDDSSSDTSDEHDINSFPMLNLRKLIDMMMMMMMMIRQVIHQINMIFFYYYSFPYLFFSPPLIPRVLESPTLLNFTFFKPKLLINRSTLSFDFVLSPLNDTAISNVSFTVK